MPRRLPSQISDLPNQALHPYHSQARFAKVPELIQRLQKPPNHENTIKSHPMENLNKDLVKLGSRCFSLRLLLFDKGGREGG